MAKRPRRKAITRLARSKIERAARKAARAARIAALLHIAVAAPSLAPNEGDIAAANPYFGQVIDEFPKGHDKRRRRKINYVIRPRKRKSKGKV
jgi:hypothetical protein